MVIARAPRGVLCLLAVLPSASSFSSSSSFSLLQKSILGVSRSHASRTSYFLRPLSPALRHRLDSAAGIHTVKSCMDVDGEEGGQRVSVSGPVYKGDGPEVTLYTKYQCTLCDKVKDVLLTIKDEHPHSLTAVDITDPENKEWWDRYKYDIPVLHVGGQYWTKHKLEASEAVAALKEAKTGTFEPRKGQPNAAAMERGR